MRMHKRICSECGKCLLKNSKAKTCSNRCNTARWRRLNPDKNRKNYTVWNSKNRHKIRVYNHNSHVRYMESRPDSICALPECGSAFRPFGRRMYCSPECTAKAKNRTPASRSRRRRWVIRHRDAARAAQRRWRHETDMIYPWYSLIRQARSRARQKGLKYNLSDDWAREKWTGKCELTGLAFAKRGDPDWKKYAMRASLDRIIPSKGYIKSNCRFILYSLNSMKVDGSDKTIFVIARKLLKLK